MRKILVTNICTLDGFYAGEGGNPMVLNMDGSFDAYNLVRMRAASTVLLGRTSFELFGSFWPTVADAPDDPANPGLSVTNREFSRLYRDIAKLVIGDTTEVAEDHPWAATTTTIRRSDVVARLRIERARDGGDIVIFGSHVLWNSLLAEGLVDEIHLIIGPQALGAGEPLFTAPASLHLASAERLGQSDNVLHRYVTA